MAYLKTIPIHSVQGITNCQEYVSDNKNNKEKSTYSLSNKDDLNDLINYVNNPGKIHIEHDGEKIVLESGHNCDINTAITDFEYDRHKYELYQINHGRTPHTGFGKKQDGTDKEARMAYHLIMSFEERDDLSPQLVHRIGQEFCERALGEYRATITTHVKRTDDSGNLEDTKHLHNHIVFNAFNMNGKTKYRDTMEQLKVIRDISDKISLEYGLDIILDEHKSGSLTVIEDDRYGHSKEEYNARSNGYSWKEELKKIIRATVKDITASTDNNWASFVYKMRLKGIDVTETTNGNIKYTVYLGNIRSEENKRTIYAKTLGAAYMKPAIMESIGEITAAEAQKLFREQNLYRKPTSAQHEKTHSHTHKSSIFIARYTVTGRRRSDLEMLFLGAKEFLELNMGKSPDREVINKYKDDLSNPVIAKSAQMKIKDMQSALNHAIGFGISDEEQLKKLKSECYAERKMVEKELSELSARKDASMRNVDRIHKALDLKREIEKHEVLKGIDMQLLFYSDDRQAEDMFAVNYPSTGMQRKELISLTKEKGYRTDKNVTELSYTDAARALDFLKGKANIKPASLLTEEEYKQQRKIKAIENKYSSILENVYRHEPASIQELALIKEITKRKPEYDYVPENEYEARRILNYLQPGIFLLHEISPANDSDSAKKISKGQILDLELLLDANHIDYPIPVEELSQAEFNNIMDYLINGGKAPEFYTSDAAFTKQASIKNQLFEKSIAGLSLDEQKLLVHYRSVLNDLIKDGITERMFASTLSQSDALSDECNHLKYRIRGLEYEYGVYLRLQHNIENAKNEDYRKDVYHGFHEMKEQIHEEAPEEFIEPEITPILEDKNLGIYDDMGLICIKNLTDDDIIITELHIDEKNISFPFTLGPGEDNFYKPESFDLNILKERGVEYIVDREVHLLNPESMAKGNTFDHYENVEDALKCLKYDYTPDKIYQILRARGYGHAEINTAMRWEGMPVVPNRGIDREF